MTGDRVVDVRGVGQVTVRSIDKAEETAIREAVADAFDALGKFDEDRGRMLAWMTRHRVVVAAVTPTPPTYTDGPLGHIRVPEHGWTEEGITQLHEMAVAT